MTYLVTQATASSVKINALDNVRRSESMPSYGKTFIEVPKGPYKGYIQFNASTYRPILEIKETGASKIIPRSGQKIALDAPSNADALKELCALPEGAEVPAHLTEQCDEWMR